MLVVAVALFAFAGLAYKTWADVEHGKAQARSAGLPDAVSLGEFQVWSDIHPADEVHVVVKFFPALNYNLRMTRKGKVSSSVEERGAMFLFGPEDSPGSRTVRGVLLIDEADGERWVEEDLMPGMLSSDATQVTARLNGYMTTTPRLRSMAEDALRERGLTKAPEFFFMESWGSGGRERALQPDTTSGGSIAAGVAGLGMIFLLVAIRRFVRRHRMLEQRELLARQVELSRAELIAKYNAQGLPVPQVLTAPLKPRRSKTKGVLAVLFAVFLAVIALAKLGHLDGALFAMPIMMVMILVIGMQQIAKAISGGISRLGGKVAQKVIPERSGPTPSPVFDANVRPLPTVLPDSPLRVSDNNLPGGAAIRTIPSLGNRLSSGLSAPGLIKWAPFAIGVVVMFVSAKMFDGLGQSGQVGQTPTVASLPVQAPATEVPVASFGLPQLLTFSDMSVGGMVLTTLGAVALMALLGFGLNLMVSRYAARRNISYPNDPWVRLDRMTAAERARGLAGKVPA